MITFKEFEHFCNERAYDGRWNMISALNCMEIIKDCREHSWYEPKREKYFREKYAGEVTRFVNDTYIEMIEKDKSKDGERDAED